MFGATETTIVNYCGYWMVEEKCEKTCSFFGKHEHPTKQMAYCIWLFWWFHKLFWLSLKPKSSYPAGQRKHWHLIRSGLQWEGLQSADGQAHFYSSAFFIFLSTQWLKHFVNTEWKEETESCIIRNWFSLGLRRGCKVITLIVTPETTWLCVFL